jgi:hypothetical protein
MGLEIVQDNFVIERILLFIVGSVFVVGALIFSKQSLDSAKNIYQCALFAILGFMAGMLFICWSLGGPPE